MSEPFNPNTNPITRPYDPKPQNPKHSGPLFNQLRARWNRPKPRFQVGSWVWEMMLGGKLEKRFVGDVKYDEAQGMWSYLVKKEGGAEDLGWLGESSLSSDGPAAVGGGGC